MAASARVPRPLILPRHKRKPSNDMAGPQTVRWKHDFVSGRPRCRTDTRATAPNHTESALRIGLGEHLPALVKKPAVCEVSFAQIVRSIARGIE